MLLKTITLLMLITSPLIGDPVHEKQKDMQEDKKQSPDKSKYNLPKNYFQNQEGLDAYSDSPYPDSQEKDDYFESQGFSVKTVPYNKENDHADESEVPEESSKPKNPLS